MNQASLIGNWARSRNPRDIDLLFARVWIADIDVIQRGRILVAPVAAAAISVDPDVALRLSVHVHSTFAVAGISGSVRTVDAPGPSPSISARGSAAARRGTLTFLLPRPPVTGTGRLLIHVGIDGSPTCDDATVWLDTGAGSVGHRSQHREHLRAGLRADPTSDPRDVMLNGLGRDEQPLADRAIRQPDEQQFHDLPLAFAEH